MAKQVEAAELASVAVTAKRSEAVRARERPVPLRFVESGGAARVATTSDGGKAVSRVSGGDGWARKRHEADDAAFSGPAALPPHLIQHRIEIGQIHGDVFRPVVRHAALAGLEHRLRTFTRLSG